MCYNFATFVLYLDVITLIYRENRLTSSETSLSAKKRRNKLIINELRRFFIEWLIKICATFQLEVQQTSLSR